MHSLSFGALVQRRRRALGLTQQELAGQVGCSTVTIRKIESDERRPSPPMAERLARFLELDDDERAAFLRLARVEAPAAAPAAPGNLPALLPPLVGRDELLAGARNRLLRRGPRLFTLTGPGGVGKTSLALRLAAAVAPEFPDGVYLVDLAPVAQADRLLAAVAAALEVPPQGAQGDLERLREALGPRRALLLLDNLEQIAGAGGPVAELLAACPDLAALATSRVALRAPGEQLLAVPPLALPPDDEAEPLRSPAVELFVQRARAARADFDPGDGRAIAAICARLDGLPLAIELVAARAGVLDPPELLRRLAGGDGAGALRLGAAGGPGLPARQRTLADTIDWSASLLPEHHWLLLLTLGVFAGGFDLPAAEAVAADLGLGPDELVDGLQELVASSLLTRQTLPEAGTRFALLHTIGAYSQERLAALGLAEAARARHAAHFRALAAAADEGLQGPDQAQWYARLDREHANMRAALGWALGADPGTAAWLGRHLWWYWLARGHWREGQRWLEAVLALADGGALALDPAARADLCKGAATLAKELCDYEAAGRRYDQALALARQIGDARGLATTLNNYGGMLHRQGQFEAAAACYEESLALLRALDLRGHVATISGNLATLNQEFGRFAAALPYHEEALALLRVLDDPRLLASALNSRAELAVFQGELATARACYEESLALSAACADEHGQMVARHGQGIVAHFAGEHAAAIALQQQALPVSQRQGDQYFLIVCLEACAFSAGALGSIQAARLFGAAAALRERLSLPLAPAYAALYGAALERAAAAHDPRAWAATLSHGRTLTPDQAVEIALGLREDS